MSGKFTIVRRRNRKEPVGDFNGDYDTIFTEEKAEAKKISATVDKFVTKTCRGFADAAIDAIRNEHKTFYLFTYNDDPDRGDLLNETIEGMPTGEILRGEWVEKVRKFHDKKKCLPIYDRIRAYIFSSKFNNGIDPQTQHPYHISIFHYKRPTSKFSNGIMISRDGNKYT